MSAVPSVIISLALGSAYHILCHFIAFGINLRTFAGEAVDSAVNKGKNSAVNLHAYVYRPEFLHCLELCIGVCRLTLFGSACIVISHLEFPCSDRHGNKNCLAYRVVFTRAGNRNGGNILVVLYGIGRFKAFRNLHMVKLPMAHIVKVDICCDRLNLFYVRRNYIRIPYGTELDLIKRRIVCNDLDRGFARVCIYSDLAYYRSIVALLIACREFYVMQSVRQNRVGNRNNSVFNGAGDFVAVDICLYGTFVKTGVV